MANCFWTREKWVLATWKNLLSKTPFYYYFFIFYLFFLVCCSTVLRLFGSYKDSVYSSHFGDFRTQRQMRFLVFLALQFSTAFSWLPFRNVGSRQCCSSTILSLWYWSHAGRCSILVILNRYHALFSCLYYQLHDYNCLLKMHLKDNEIRHSETAGEQPW